MKNILILISITILAIGAIFLFTSLKKNEIPDVKSGTTSAVSVEENKQVITVSALSRGYYPSKITAQAGIKTVLKVESKNSYGCERSFRIPKLNTSKILPQNGITEFDLGTPKKGENILGTCSMGMYTFTINFE